MSMNAEPSRAKVPLGGKVMGLLVGAVAGGTAALLLGSDQDWGAVYVAAALGMFVLAPLLVANLVMTVLYVRQRAPGQVLGWMWLPLVVVASVAMSMHGLSGQARRANEAQYPSVREMHVNLSGRSIWFDPAGQGGGPRGRQAMPGDAPGVFTEVTRYFGDDDQMAIYKVARLAPSFRSMTVFVETPPSGATATLPVVWQAEAFPDVASFMRHLSFQGSEASVTEHWFFHYADRVEVVPALSLAGSQSMDLWGGPVPMVGFHIANLTHQQLARLEVDGATLGLGSEARAPEQAQGHGCTERNHAAYAINRLQAPLKLRWQWAQANPVWHEAMVEVPAFRERLDMPRGSPHLTSVTLYLQADGTVVAERSLLRGSPSGVMSLQTTGPTRPLAKTPPCGYAPDRYSEAVQVFRD